MLYSILKRIIRYALKGYFKSIVILGKENIPKTGGTIYIVNHPSALLDPLMIATLVSPKFHFIAAAEYFGKGFVKWLLTSQFNMIPVYRPEMYEGEKVDNDAMFRDCYTCLEHGGSIMIFPEGNSVTEKRLRPLKTGTIRIYRGAKSNLGPDHQINIIPIGLNYTNPHKFQSRAVINIGKPIDLETLEVDHLDEKAQIQAQTAILEDKLRDQILHIENYALAPMISDVDQVYKFNLWNDFGVTKKQNRRKLGLQQEIINAVDYFNTHSPDTIDRLKQKITTYFDLLGELNLNNDVLNKKVSRTVLLMVLIILSPVFLIGYLINSIPFYLTRGYFNKNFSHRLNDPTNEQSIAPQFKGTVIFSIGTLVFLFWYLIVATIAGIVGPWWMGVIAFILCYLSGRGTLYYLTIANYLKQKWKLWRAKSNEKNRYDKLLDIHQQILNELNQFKETYLNEVVNVQEQE
ncbi:MAG: 1-acyl-sn-glycerol-3-phosphate acyltransferase [Cyclobacteriaceae bacterium]